MLEKGPEIFTGIKILMKLLGVKQAFVGIEANKPDAIKLFRDLAMRHIGIAVVPLRVKYPQGGEKQLIKAITGREVPSGKLPIDVGTWCECRNTYAIYEAVQKNKPLIERVVTVTGKKLANPGNFLVRIGTPVEKLLEAAGGFAAEYGKNSLWRSDDGEGSSVNGYSCRERLFRYPGYAT
jgi:electron transport complex protein RnfC